MGKKEKYSNIARSWLMTHKIVDKYFAYVLKFIEFQSLTYRYFRIDSYKIEVIIQSVQKKEVLKISLCI